MSDNDVNLNDANEPFKPFLRNVVSPLSTSVFKNHFLEISEIRINSDKNLIFGDYEKEKKFRLRQKREEVDLRSVHAIFPRTFNQMTIVTSGNTEIYNRYYRKLFDIIVEIGGFFNGIIYAATLILYLYSNNIILWQCIYSIISSKELEERLINPMKIKNENEIENNNKSNNNEDNNINSNNNLRNDNNNIINVKKSLREERNNNSIQNNNNNSNNNEDKSNEQLRIDRNNSRK